MASRSKRTTRKLNPGVYARPDGNLQAHMAIPADVRFAFGGKSKIVRSLGTSDPAQANRMHAQLVTKQEAAYDLIRKGTASSAFEAFARRLHESQLDYIDEQNDLVSFNGYASNPFLQQTFGQRLNSADPEELAATVGWAADWFFAEQTGVDPHNLPPELRASAAYLNPDRDFGGGVATGVVLSYIYKGFRISFPTDFLDALAAASSMIVTKGKGDDQVILTHINLRGSGAAVASLRRCAEHVQRANAAQARREQRWDHISRDPFATQPTREEPKVP